MIRRPPRSTLFPSTPLFRSLKAPGQVGDQPSPHVAQRQALQDLVEGHRQTFWLDALDPPDEGQVFGDRHLGIERREFPQIKSEEDTSQIHVSLHLLCPLFFFNDTATTEIYTLSLHAALPISESPGTGWRSAVPARRPATGAPGSGRGPPADVLARCP